MSKKRKIKHDLHGIVGREPLADFVRSHRGEEFIELGASMSGGSAIDFLLELFPADAIVEDVVRRDSPYEDGTDHNGDYVVRIDDDECYIGLYDASR